MIFQCLQLRAIRHVEGTQSQIAGSEIGCGESYHASHFNLRIWDQVLIFCSSPKYQQILAFILVIADWNQQYSISLRNWKSLVFHQWLSHNDHYRSEKAWQKTLKRSAKRYPNWVCMRRECCRSMVCITIRRSYMRSFPKKRLFSYIFA